MRRLTVLFLLVVLLFQGTWAVAGSLCAHEEAGGHFGHHSHVHQAGGEAGQDASHDPSQGADSDCAYCHASVFQSLALPGMGPADHGGPQRFQAPPSRFESPCAAEPERPKWPRAA